MFSMCNIVRCWDAAHRWNIYKQENQDHNALQKTDFEHED